MKKVAHSVITSHSSVILAPLVCVSLPPSPLPLPQGSLYPGLHLDVKVSFAPKEWHYHHDCVLLHCSQGRTLMVPLHAFPIANVSKVPKQITFPCTALGNWWATPHITPDLCSRPYQPPSSPLPLPLLLSLPLLPLPPSPTALPSLLPCPVMDLLTFNIESLTRLTTLLSLCSHATVSAHGNHLTSISASVRSKMLCYCLVPPPPSPGVIPGRGSVTISVIYTPSDYTTALAQLQVGTADET